MVCPTMTQMLVIFELLGEKKKRLTDKQHNTLLHYNKVHGQVMKIFRTLPVLLRIFPVQISLFVPSLPVSKLRQKIHNKLNKFPSTIPAFAKDKSEYLLVLNRIGKEKKHQIFMSGLCHSERLRRKINQSTDLSLTQRYSGIL